jgi:tetratricopeptide (TPR) repeat protein
MSGSIYFRKKDDRLLAVGMLLGFRENSFSDALVLNRVFTASLPLRNVFRPWPANKGEIFVARGKLYLFGGRMEPAIVDFDAALRIYPRDTDALEYRGLAYRLQGQTDRALEDLSKAIKLGIATPELLSSRCWARAAAGRELDEALADCSESLRQRPHDIETLEGRALAWLRRGNHSEAIADYEAVLRQEPQRAFALYGRGYVKGKQGDLAGGNADMVKAKSIRSRIAEEYARYGLN